MNAMSLLTNPGCESQVAVRCSIEWPAQRLTEPRAIVADFVRHPDSLIIRVRNPDTSPVKEPLREPVKEKQGARARDDRFEEFFGELLDVLGFDIATCLPGWWQGRPPRGHVRRWITNLDLTEDRIIAVARDSRERHLAPPDGPRAVDRAMERAARASSAQKAKTDDQRRKPRSKPTDTPLASMDEIAGFYARLVNGDGYLPSNAISNTVRNAMLERGCVRGVWHEHPFPLPEPLHPPAAAHAWRALAVAHGLGPVDLVPGGGIPAPGADVAV